LVLIIKIDNLIAIFFITLNIMNSPIQNIAENIIYELWFSIAESIFKRVCKITELDDEQINALKQVALRPNDFRVEIE
jgi:hypothetical protein